MRHDSGFSALELLIAVAIIGSIAAMSAPLSSGMIDDIRLRGDAQGVSSAVALTKLTAASKFTRSRLYVDLNAHTYQVQFWQTGATPGWVADGGVRYLSTDGRFGSGIVTTPPPNSQAALAQPAVCLADDGTAIANTSCLFFNSRGLPVSSAGVPVTTQVLYLRGPSGVFAVVLGSTGQQQVWRSTLTSTGVWRQQ